MRRTPHPAPRRRSRRGPPPAGDLCRIRRSIGRTLPGAAVVRGDRRTPAAGCRDGSAVSPHRSPARRAPGGTVLTRWSMIHVLALLAAGMALAAAPRQAGTSASPPRPAVIGYVFPQDALI